jgi:hypothetical protein
MKRFIFICLLVGIIISCDKKEDNDIQIKQISYGTSFGMCVGYCKSDILLRLGLGLVIYSLSGWNDTVKTITCTETLTDESWNSYKNSLNPNDFFKLEETIGCPDCADGGAEWIEIEVISGKKHRVTFEYMNEPEELKSLVIGLRELKEISKH